MEPLWREDDYLSCSGSRRFAKEMVAASPFSDLDHAIRCARDIWFNKVDVKGWLESFAAHPDIGATSKSVSQWSKEEQSAALATATGSSMQELVEWNVRYREKFGFVFLICASGRSTPEILAELKKRFPNRPIVELEIAGQEEMKIIELRLAKLFKSESRAIPATSQLPVSNSRKPEGRYNDLDQFPYPKSVAQEKPLLVWASLHHILMLMLRPLQIKPLQFQSAQAALVHPSRPMSWMLLVAIRHQDLMFTWRCGRTPKKVHHSQSGKPVDGFCWGLQSRAPMVGAVSYWTLRIMSHRAFIGLVSTRARIIPQASSPTSASYLRSRNRRNLSIFTFPFCSHPSDSLHTAGVEKSESPMYLQYI